MWLAVNDMNARVSLASYEADLDRALWWAHHVPHNVDRALALGNGEAAEKRELLAHMRDDQDRRRKAAARGIRLPGATSRRSSVR